MWGGGGRGVAVPLWRGRDVGQPPTHGAAACAEGLCNLFLGSEDLGIKRRRVWERG